MGKFSKLVNATKKTVEVTKKGVTMAKTAKEMVGNVQYNKDYNFNEEASNIQFNSTEDLYNYCVKRGFGEGTTKNWAMKHFEPVFNAIQPNETIYLPFIGLLNYTDSTHHDGTYTFIVTDKRILIGKKVVMGEGTREVKWENVNDISYDSSMLMGTLSIRTYNVTINVGINKNALRDIYNELNNVFNQLKENKITRVVTELPKEETKNDPYEEIKKLKELLDMDIINQEEFDQKKKELLGL